MERLVEFAVESDVLLGEVIRVTAFANIFTPRPRRFVGHRDRLVLATNRIVQPAERHAARSTPFALSLRADLSASDLHL
jgi:hypothetical protein